MGQWDDTVKANEEAAMPAADRYKGYERGHMVGMSIHGRTGGSDKITLQSAIEDAMLQAEKLGQMVVELTQRLEPVRGPEPEETTSVEDNMNIARIRPEYGSPYAARLTNISDIIKASQVRIARVMDDLDL